MKRLFKHIAVIIILLFAEMFTNCMLNNIKDTDSILHDDYKYLSLVDGAIAWETGVIRRLYDLGHIFPVYKQDKQGRKLIENYQNLDQSSKLVRLIHLFFYRIPGSTGQADFGTTVQLASKDPHAIVPLVAELMMQCGKLQQQREQFQQAVAYVKEIVETLTQEQIIKLDKKKDARVRLEQKIKDVQIRPWNKQESSAFISLCKSVEKNLLEELGQEKIQELEMYREVAEQFFNLIAQTTNNLIKLFNPVVFKKNDRVESFIVEALNECDPHNPGALYPTYTVEMVLLAFVYKKYSADRSILKLFYDALNVKLDNKLLQAELTDLWIQDSFKSVTQAEAFSIIERIFAAENLIHNIKKHFAELVYTASQNCFLSTPSLIGYADAVYEYEKGKKTPQFPDCMCNAMRNFINLYAYDAEQNKFTHAKLQQRMGIKIELPSLVDFLHTFGDVNKASLPEAHNDWIGAVAHIPYVAYRQMVDATTGVAIRATAKGGYFGKGYIFIPKNEQNDTLLNWLTHNDYRVITANQYNCELRASVKNIIIVLDHLLQLNLFTGAGGLGKEFMRPDFIKEYFPKLCAVLNATGFLSTDPSAIQGEQDKDFDALDYTDTIIYTTIKLAGISCVFRTYAGHGQLNLPNQRIANPLLFWGEINNFSGQPSLSLLITNLICKQDISFDHLRNNLNYLYINLFAAPLENAGFLDSIISALPYDIMNTLPFIMQLYSMELLLRLADQQPDEAVGLDMKIKISESFLRYLSEDDLRANPDLVHTIEKIVLQAPSAGMIRFLVKSLIDKGQSFVLTAEVAEKLAQSDKIHDKEYAINKLFPTLLSKNQGIKEAIRTAEYMIGKGSGAVISLLPLLFAKGVGLQEVIQTTATLIFAESVQLKEFGLRIFTMLFEKGLGFQEALQAAQKAVESQDSLQRVYGLKIFKLLVDNDHAFKEAAQATQHIDFKGEYNEVNAGFDIFKALVSKNQAVAEALEFATHSFGLNNNITYRLLDDLKIKAPEETKKAIEKALANSDVESNAKQKLRNLLK